MARFLSVVCVLVFFAHSASALPIRLSVEAVVDDLHRPERFRETPALGDRLRFELVLDFVGWVVPAEATTEHLESPEATLFFTSYGYDFVSELDSVGLTNDFEFFDSTVRDQLGFFESSGAHRDQGLRHLSVVWWTEDLSALKRGQDVDLGFLLEAPNGQITVRQPSSARIGARIDRVKVLPIPEPGTAILMGLGLVSLGVRRQSA